MAKGETDKPPVATLATTATRPEQLWTYERAVNYATGRLRSAQHMTDERQWLDPSIRGMDAVNTDPQQLISDARLKPDAFEQLRFGIAAKIERGEPLPDCLANWACAFLRGEVEEPVRRSGTKTQSGKQRAILRVMRDLVEHGDMNASRNDESKTKECACDAVAAALQKLGMKPAKWTGVRDIWKKRHQIAPELFEK